MWKLSRVTYLGCLLVYHQILVLGCFFEGDSRASGTTSNGSDPPPPPPPPPPPEHFTQNTDLSRLHVVIYLYYIEFKFPREYKIFLVSELAFDYMLFAFCIRVIYAYPPPPPSTHTQNYPVSGGTYVRSHHLKNLKT